MLESFILLVESLPVKARMDENYYVGGYSDDGACRANCFALPGRELRISAFVYGIWSSYDGCKIAEIPIKDQQMLVDLKWEIPKEISKQMQYYPVEHLDEVLRHALQLDDPDEFFAKARAEIESDADTDEAADAAPTATTDTPTTEPH